MNPQISIAEKVLTITAIMFCTTILVVTPWPSVHQIFNPHSPTYVNR
jgi:hypothetical protein